VDDRVVDALDDERRHPHRGDHVTHVDLEGHIHHRDRVARRHRRRLKSAERLFLHLGAAEQKRLCPFRIGGGEENGHRPALGDAERRQTLRADRVEHGTRVLHPLLQRPGAGALGQPMPRRSKRISLENDASCSQKRR
jgi:hypothetical protein